MTLRPPGDAHVGAFAFALAVSVSLTPAAAPALAAPLDRATAVARGLERAPEGAAFRAAAADSARRVSAAGAYPSAPHLAVEAGFDRVGPFVADLNELRLEVSQEIDAANLRGARRDAAVADAAALHAAGREHALTLARTTEEAFGALLVAARRRALADTAAHAAARLAAAGRRAAGSEAISAYDLRRLELELARARDRAALEASAAERAAATLRALLLAPSDEAIEPVDDLAATAWRCPADSLAAIALERRPDVLAARADEALLAAEAQVAAREGRPGPEVGLFVARSRDRVEADAFDGALDGIPGFDGFDDRSTSFGASVTVPLSFLAPNRNAWQAGRFDVAASRARAALRRLEGGVPVEVAAACAAVESAQERGALLAAALTHAAADRARIESAYREGRLELESALAQRERLLDAALAELDALSDLEAARSALARATGLTHAELAAALSGAPRGASR